MKNSERIKRLEEELNLITEAHKKILLIEEEDNYTEMEINRIISNRKRNYDVIARMDRIEEQNGKLFVKYDKIRKSISALSFELARFKNKVYSSKIPIQYKVNEFEQPIGKAEELKKENIQVPAFIVIDNYYVALIKVISNSTNDMTLQYRVIGDFKKNNFFKFFNQYKAKAEFLYLTEFTKQGEDYIFTLRIKWNIY